MNPLKILTALILVIMISACESNDLDTNFNSTNLSKDDTSKVDDGCETAFVYCGPVSECFLDLDMGFNRWGWTNGPMLPETGHWFYIYAGAGQCDADKGTMVGKLTIKYFGSTATITYNMDAGYTLNEVQLYVGNDMIPSKKNGKYTVAPGQYPYKDDNLNGATTYTFTVDGLSGEIYFIAHAVVCGFTD